MAKMVNVNRDIQDSFYRYKMPLLEAKIEGRGNGIKTLIPNMVDVAKALDRPPAYPTKYLGVELGAQTQMQVDADRYIVNGSFDADRFQDLLDGFIKKFVLCEECSNPETKLKVTKRKEIESRCIACGHRTFLPLTHRLTTYIINNPPSGSEGLGKSKGKTKEERRAAKNNSGGKKSESTSPTPTENGNGFDISASCRDNVKMREGGAALDAPAPVDEAEVDLEWSVDTSEEAVRARTEELGTGVTSLTLTDDLEKPMGERLDIFAKYVMAKKTLPKFPAKEVVGEAERLDCKEKGVMVLVELLFLDGDVFDLLKKYQGILQRFTFENSKAQKYFLGGMEKLIESREDLLAKVPRLFKDLYDKDIIDEESFVSWGEKPSKKYVSKELSQKIHEKAAKFIGWLKEAESEESEEEENDVEFASAVVPSVNDAPAAATSAPAADEDNDDDDDIDIDDI